MTAGVLLARIDDREEVARLLRECGLPDDFHPSFPIGFVVARDAGVVVGCAALESYGDAGLLRSVAVAPSARGTKLGRALVEDRLSAARDGGMARVYLLTTGASAFFKRLGFVDSSRQEAPEAVRDSTQFQGGACASAACLVRSARPRDSRA